MTEETLKPCPFCGGPAPKPEQVSEISVNRWIFACECGATFSDDYYTKEEAIAGWNTRHEPEAREPVACYWMCTKFDTTRHDYKFSWRLVSTHEKARELAAQGYEIEEVPPLATPPDEALNNAWIVAMAVALGVNSGYDIPIKPEADAFEKLFGQLRKSDDEARRLLGNFLMAYHERPEALKYITDEIEAYLAQTDKQEGE